MTKWQVGRIGKKLGYESKKHTRLIVFMLGFAVVGYAALLSVKAATPTASSEPENGALSSKVVAVNDSSASNGAAVKFGSNNTCGAGTLDLSCWPGPSNTGYQNAPGYPGTPGIADSTKLRQGKAGDAQCPTTFESHHTYSFCKYSGGITIGSPRYPGDPDVGQHLTDVHFVGFLLEDIGPTNDMPMIMMYCDSNCTLDYFTIKPSGLNAPDITGTGKHGVSYDKSYGSVLGAGWGAYYTTGHGFSLTHSDIWGYQSGIIVGSSGGKNTAATPNLIQDNWLHDQGQCIEHSGCLTHADGIGMVDTGGSVNYLTINHNNMPFIQDNTNNIAFQEGTYDHIAVTNNVLSGDGYTVAIWDTSTNITFTGNILTNYAQHYFGINYGKNFWDTPGSCWARNKFVWDPTGVNPYYTGGPGFGGAGYGPITSADSGKYWVPSGLSTTDYNDGGC
jgi:hypothetical protein